LPHALPASGGAGLCNALRGFLIRICFVWLYVFRGRSLLLRCRYFARVKA